MDALRRTGSLDLVRSVPVAALDPRLRALIDATVETLCAELSLVAPEWCRAVNPLDRPWFVSGVENLKAIALVGRGMIHQARGENTLAENDFTQALLEVPEDPEARQHIEELIHGRPPNG